MNYKVIAQAQGIVATMYYGNNKELADKLAQECQNAQIKVNNIVVGNVSSVRIEAEGSTLPPEYVQTQSYNKASG